MPPELQIAIINAAIVLLAYLGIYPTMGRLTAGRMMAVDIVLTVLALGVAAALFAGSGTRFSLLLISVNWAMFSILSMAAMEIPLFLWFCRKRGIDLTDPD